MGKIKHFDSLDYDTTKKQDYPQKCIQSKAYLRIFVNKCLVLAVEGWVLFASGLHEEANEEDVKSIFSEYGQVTNIAVNIDRRTGFLKVCYTEYSINAQLFLRYLVSQKNEILTVCQSGNGIHIN